MAEIGKKYVYRLNGVCTLLSEEVRDGEKYYKLIPDTDKGLTIFIPESNAVLREPMTSSEAKTLLDSIDEMDNIWDDNVKERRKVYERIMHECKLYDMSTLIKTLVNKKEERLKNGKFMYSYEENILETAVKSVCGELSSALGIEMNKAEQIFIDRCAAVR